MNKRSTIFSRDRRSTQRHDIKTPLRVRVWKSGLPEERAESVNLSQCGIFFLTDTRLAEGEIIEVLLKMPEEVSGQPTNEWRCTGHVVRVEQVGSPQDKFGVGVHFYCYDASRFEQPDLRHVPRSRRDMPIHQER
ncbi:MAG TPA: PilZ domain-containing protein [Candidatus Acidoferrum sp.]|nr:PilZ domain-containing protein [Candidatus Acidoferrum sp.]